MGLRPKSRRRTLLAAALLSLAIVAGTAGDAAAAPSPGGLAHELAGVWPGLQRHDGSFYDYVHPSWDGRYSEAMLGLALMRTGLREGDDRLVATAFRAYRYSFARGDRQVEYESAFETYAMAAGYNIARARLAHDPRFASLRPGWKAWLRHARPSFLGVRRGAFFNKHVVEATAWIELVRTGLSSRVRGSVLSRRNWAAHRAAHFVNTDVPNLTRKFRGRVGGKPARLLADPAPSPLAYHGLSLGFYARAVRSLGSRARRSARRTLLEAARASLGLAGPDGDVAYAGRSQEQAWALSLTAYGVDVAGSLAGASERGQLRAFGARLRSRLA